MNNTIRLTKVSVVILLFAAINLTFVLFLAKIAGTSNIQNSEGSWGRSLNNLSGNAKPGPVNSCDPMSDVIVGEINANNPITVSNVPELRNAIDTVNNAGGNRTILIEDGVYEIASTSWFPYITADNVLFRSVSGNRDNVFLKGGGMRLTGSTENVFFIAGQNITIADITVGEAGNHGIQTDAGGDGLWIHNVRFVDTYEQMIKGAASGGVGANNGIVECSSFSYSNGIGPQYYIGGIDVHEGINWIVRDNIFEDIKSPDNDLAEHAIHFWSGATNTLVERNRIIDCDRGIGFGLGSRGHLGGLIKNNFVHTVTDVGIGLESSPSTMVYNNTVFTQNYFNSIEYRFSATTNVIISNNITNEAIASRDGGYGAVSSNVTNAESSWFIDVVAGDLHLAYEIASVIDQGVTLADVNYDYDQQTRPIGSEYDIGADEYGQENQPPTITITEPDGANDTADTSFTIGWIDADPDDNADISLYYDIDNSGNDGAYIVNSISEDDETDSYVWNTSAVAVGTYYIYAVINDGVNTPVIDYSDYPVFIQRQQICPTSLCNGDFEAAIELEYWTRGHGTNQIVMNIAQEGGQSFYSEHTYDTDVNPRWSGISQVVTVEAAQIYGLGGYYRSENASRGHIKITWKNSSSAILQVDYPITNINGTNHNWIEFSKLVTSPTGAVSAEIKIWHGVDGSSQNVLGSRIWMDTLSFDTATTACGTLCNETFEQGILYWTQSGAAGSHTVETIGAYEGQKTLRSEQLYSVSDLATWAGITQFAQVKEGTTYRLRLWLKTQNVSNGHARIRWRDSAGILLNTQYPIAGINGVNSNWFKREAAITAPPNAAKAELAIWHGVTGGTTNVPGSILWIDNITLICLSLCNAGFEDGSLHWESNGKNEGEIITSDVQEGLQAMRVVQNLLPPDMTQWAGVSQMLMVSGGTSYGLNFWMKKENTVQGHVKVKWRDANDQLILQEFPRTNMNGTDITWISESMTLLAPANADTIEIFIWHGVDGTNQNAAGSTLYLDNITFDQIP